MRSLVPDFEIVATAGIERALRVAGLPRLSILNYHRVVGRADVMRPSAPTAAEFDWQMRVLARRFSPLSLGDALARLEQGSLPSRAVCVTFDDGYADNLTNALPILKKYGVPATVFVTTGFLDGGLMWNDIVLESARLATCDAIDLSDMELGRFPLGNLSERRAVAERLINRLKYLPHGDRDAAVARIEAQCGPLPRDLMLSTEQLRELHQAGIDIGGHTRTHPILASLGERAAQAEIVEGKHELEEIIGSRVCHFAYPNGNPGKDYALIHRDMVRAAGFEAAVSTHAGVAGPATDRWQLPRFTPWDKAPWRFTGRLLWNRRSLQ